MLAAFAGFTVAAAMAALYCAGAAAQAARRGVSAPAAPVARGARPPRCSRVARLARRCSRPASSSASRASSASDVDAAMTVTVVIWALYAALLVLRREAAARPPLAALLLAGFVLVAVVLPLTHFASMKLALAGVSHHRGARSSCASESRSTSTLPARSRERARRTATRRRALDVQPHRALPRVRDEQLATRRWARCSRSPGTARPSSRAGRVSARATSRRHFTSSASPPGSTRWCRARARSSARCATPSRRAPGPAPRSHVPAGAPRRPARAGGDGDRRRAPHRCRPLRPRSPSRSSASSAGRRVVLVGAGQDERARPPGISARAARRSRPSSTARSTHGEELGAQARRARRSTLDGVAAALARRRRRRLVDERARLRPLAATASPPRCARAAAGRCCSSTSPCRATSIRALGVDRRVLRLRRRRPRGRRRRRRSRAAAARRCEAERIVAAEAERFRAWQASLAVVPAIASLRARAEEIRDRELAREAGSAAAGERAAAVDTVTAQIVNKLLHLPTVRMKEAAVTADGVVYADVVRHLFGLGEDDGEA